MMEDIANLVNKIANLNLSIIIIIIIIIIISP